MTSNAKKTLDQAINEIENEWGYEGIKEEMYEIMKPILKELEMLDILKDNIKIINYLIFNDKIVIYLPVQYREKLKEWLENGKNNL